MSSANEDEIKKALGIDSWRNLSKDKLLSFVSEMPKLDKEVALKIIAQFPDFKSLVSGALNSLELQAEKSHKFNWKSQKKVHQAFKAYRATLDRELERDDQTPEARFQILELFRDAVEREYDKDSENKAFAVKVLTVVGAVVLAAIGGAVAVLGGKAEVGPGKDNA